MALQGWRLFGVSATLIIYIGGVIFLSMNNVPNTNQKGLRRFEQMGELADFGSSRIAGIKRKMTIYWCRQPKYLNNGVSSSAGNEDSKLQTSDGLKDRVTALASFPGSGNTWLRYLLQQATGILTGSIYKDYGLLKNGFPAESIRNSSVLVVKTHEWGPKSWVGFTNAVLLVRDPEKAILAEFNRQSGGHVGFAAPDRYKRTNGKYWQQFVTNKLKVWRAMNLNWAQNFTGPVTVVFYDDLVNHMERTLRSILSFLDFSLDEDLLECTIIRKEGIFRRKKRILPFDPFTLAMRKQIHATKQEVYKILVQTNHRC